MSDWISIEERKPKKDGRYLVVEAHTYRWVGVSAMRDGKFDMDITHWMSLPEAPKLRNGLWTNELSPKKI